MTHDPVPLERHFSLMRQSVPDSDEQEQNWILGEWILGKRKHTSWQELEEEFRCVILAEAGAGKSFEMKTRAKHAKGQGRTAFLIRIEDIKDGFNTSFDVGCADTFENWLNSKEEAWFFLDSIDEARLENPRAFKKAIKCFAARINPARQRARVFISSRPYAWRPRLDRELVEKYLPFKKPNQEQTGQHKWYVEPHVAGKSAEQDSALCVYRLNPLDEASIRKFADHRNTPQIDRLIGELKRANLMPMAERPFDLEGILLKWKTDQALDGRLDLLQHYIDRHLKEIHPDRARDQPLNLEKARHGVSLLAASVILTGERGICIPDSTQPDKGIDAETVLGDWKPADVQALLERGIFNDALHGIVRFRHREVTELLAAEWFRHQLGCGNSRQKTVSLFFGEQYGHVVCTPRLRPILPWLILFDGEIRRKALKIAPEVAVEGGDAACLPVAERKLFLRDIVRRTIEDEYYLPAHDNSAIARIARPDLTGDTLRLIREHQDIDNAVFFLSRLVWQGEMIACVPDLSGIAVDPARGIYARIAATRAVMTCGNRDQKSQVLNQLAGSSVAIPRMLLAGIVEDADPDMAVDFLFDAIGKLKACEQYETTGLSHALHSFIDRLPIRNAKSTSEPLTIIVSGLNEYLDREPHIRQQDCRVSKEFAWLLGPATHAVEKLVSARSKGALLPAALAIMLKVPVAHFWWEEDFDQYQSRLHELVPAWGPLNDALFWRSVAEERNSLETKKSNSKRLIDHWPVQWIEPIWNFDKDRFGDVLGFIVSRDFLDDKLVALSLAHQLFVQAGKPDGWLSELERIVEGSSALSDRHKLLMNSKKSQSVVEWEERVALRKEKSKRQVEEHNRSRTEWIKHLKATPSIVRRPPRLKLGEISKDQYRLLREIEGSSLRKSRGGGANWEALHREFGEDVAQAYKDAAIAHWRRFTPGLGSEGHDTSSIPYALMFGMAGLEIEASEVDGFPANLAEAEARHALRYLVWELNGFPSWLEQFYQVYPKLVLAAVFTELHWELAHTEPDQPLHYILDSLVYHAPWMHESLAPSISDWLEKNEILNHYALQHCIHILRSGDAEAVSKLAQSKISSTTAKEQLAAWYALWIDLDAALGIPAAERWLSNLPTPRASQEAQLLITELMGTRRAFNTSHGRGDFRNVKHLKALFVLMHKHIHAKDDMERADEGVYSPGLREHAQDGRDALLNQLAVIPGNETYIALSDLAKTHPDPNYRPLMNELAFKRAEEDSDLEPWSAEQVRDYHQFQEITPTTHRQLFDLTVDRLNDLKAWIEQGSDSPYKTWQRVGDEAEMRNLVAGWLVERSSGRYICTQENEFSNKQRPDILMQSVRGTSAVPIELKVLDKNWSGPKLCERLRNQLAGDYLREETAGCGVFLLVWQGKSTKCKWEINGKEVGLPDLSAALVEHWETVSDTFPGIVAIEVILIDLTIRGRISKS